MQRKDIYQFAQDLMQKVWIPFDPSHLPEFYHRNVVGHHRDQTLSFSDVENRLLWDRKNILNSRYNIQEIIADDDRFSIRFIYTASLIKTHQNIGVEVIYFYHIQTNKIAEFWTLASIEFDYKEKA
jgi:predicted ester cyclase